VTAYSREVSELGEFGEAPNDNGPGEAETPEAEPEGEAVEIGDAVPAPQQGI